MTDQAKTEILGEFKAACSSASYHYADDTGKEWGLAKKYVHTAREIANNYPEFKDDFMVILKDQLISHRDIFKY